MTTFCRFILGLFFHYGGNDYEIFIYRKDITQTAGDSIHALHDHRQLFSQMQLQIKGVGGESLPLLLGASGEETGGEGETDHQSQRGCAERQYDRSCGDEC